MSNFSISLQGQKAIVTGATSGIGKAIAIGLAKAGAIVGVNYRGNPAKAEPVLAEIQANGGEAIALQADVSQEDQVKAMFAEFYGTYQTVDILVNNAGIQRDAAFVDMTLDDWNLVLNVNLTGQFLCAREAAREFIRRGVKPEVSCAAGKIICLSSVHEVIPWAGHVNYATTKGGINMMMQSIAQELAHHKIRVNSIAPGAIKTPINEDAWSTPEAEAKLLKLIPYDRVGVTEDIAKAAVWLASDQSDYVTGTALYIDGGMTLYPGFATGSG